MPMKPGGGNKPQPYVPKGNGLRSGQYDNKMHKITLDHAVIRNKRGLYNPLRSKLVNKVIDTSFVTVGGKLPLFYKPNSVGKLIENGCLIRERYYNDKGEVYLDIDYTSHGNPKLHPHVPHVHRWTVVNGYRIRGKGEEFQ